MLCVSENFAKSLKVTQGTLKFPVTTTFGAHSAST